MGQYTDIRNRYGSAFAPIGRVAAITDGVRSGIGLALAEGVL